MTNKEFEQLLEEVKQLPYGRNKDRSDFNLVPIEKKGSCSTKHAYVKHVAINNEILDVDLVLCIFKMSATNTFAIASVLEKYSLEYIPEAHCFIRYKGEPMDLTLPESSYAKIENDILYTEFIEPEQIGEYKVYFHKAYLEKWLMENAQLNLSFSELWQIREKCIKALSGINIE